MDDKRKKARRIVKQYDFAQNPDEAIFNELQEANEHLAGVRNTFGDTDLSQLEKLQGEKGEQGEPGHTPVKGKDYFTPVEIKAFADHVTPQKGIHYTDGKDGKNGEKGDPGIPGMSGRDGKDGSPDLPEMIAQKLNTLEGVLEAKVVKGGLTMSEVVRELKKNKSLELRDIKGAKLDMSDQRWHGGGQSVTIQTENGLVSISPLKTLKVTNGTLTDDGNGVASLDTGGGGGGGTPGGPQYAVQFNNPFGDFDGSALFTYDGSTLQLTNTSANPAFTITQQQSDQAALILNNTAVTPDRDQFSIQANGAGNIGMLNFGPGDQEIHFDVTWTGANYIANNTVVSQIWAVNDGLQFYTDDGQTIGNTAIFTDPKMALKTTGQLQLNKYGSGLITGTPTYILSVDASGNIIETTAGGAQNLEQVLTVGNDANFQDIINVDTFNLNGATSLQNITDGNAKQGLRVLDVTNSNNSDVYFPYRSDGSLAQTGDILTINGSQQWYASPSPATPDLATVLTAGNSTDGQDIEGLASASNPPSVIGTLVLDEAPTAIAAAGDLAYALTSSYVYTIDITNPLSPQIVSRIANGLGTAIAVDYKAGYLFVLIAGRAQVWDMSNNSAYTVLVDVVTDDFPTAIKNRGNKFYVIGVDGMGASHIQTVDFTNPSSPTSAFSVIIDAPIGMTLDGDYIYVLGTDAMMAVIDASGDTATQISTAQDPAVIGAQFISIDVFGSYVACVANIGIISVFQVIDQTVSPTLVFSGVITDGGNTKSLRFGRYLLCSSNGGWIGIVDMGDALTPVLISSITGGDSNIVAPALQGKYLYYCSNDTVTFSIFDIHGIEITSAKIHSLEAGKANILGDLFVQESLDVRMALNVGNGGIYSEGVISGSFKGDSSGLSIFTDTINGIVPAPNNGGLGYFLRDDGTWQPGSGVTLQTNGTPNGDQSLLNLVQGTNVTITDDGFGNVTIDSTGGGGTSPSIVHNYIYQVADVTNPVVGAFTIDGVLMYINVTDIDGRDIQDLVIAMSVATNVGSIAFTHPGDSTTGITFIQQIDTVAGPIAVFQADFIGSMPGLTLVDGDPYQLIFNANGLAPFTPPATPTFSSVLTAGNTTDGQNIDGTTSFLNPPDVVTTFANIENPTAIAAGGNFLYVWSPNYISTYNINVGGIFHVSDVAGPVSGIGAVSVDFEAGYLFGVLPDIDGTNGEAIGLSLLDNSAQSIYTSILTDKFPTAIKVRGNKFYVIGVDSVGVSHIQVTNFTNPSSPTTNSNVIIDGPVDMDIVGNYIYVVGDNGMMAILEISGDTATQITTVQDPLVVARGEHYTSVVSDGTYVWCSTSGGGVTVFKVTDQFSTPTVIYSTDIFPTGVKLNKIGRYIIGSSIGGAGGSLEFLDVNAPPSPLYLGSVAITSNGNVHSSIQGKYIYSISESDTTINITDIKGIEITSAYIHSFTAGGANVLGSLAVQENVNIRQALNVGDGGIHSEGAISSGIGFFGDGSVLTGITASQITGLATIASTTNILIGDGAGNASDSGFAFPLDATNSSIITPALILDQTTPQTFTAGMITGTGLLNVTSGTLGLDTNTYITNISGQDLSTADNSTSQFATISYVDAHLPVQVDNVTLVNQAADITATPFVGTATANMYRVNYYLVTSTADVLAGAVQLVFTYTDTTGAQTETAATLVLTSIGVVAQGCFIANVTDTNSLDYAISHTGVFGSATYDLNLIAEKLN